MKLNYHSTSLVTFIYTHIIFIHILYIHLSSATEASDQNYRQEDINHFKDISEENKKILTEQIKAHLLKVLGLKEVPRGVSHNNKAYVPHAMLDEYRKVRESVRSSIPNDRDFYGKINVEDLDESNHETFWKGVYNKYGGYDVEVDMGPSRPPNMFIFKGSYDRLLHLVSINETELPDKIADLLPPSTGRVRRNHKQSLTIHLRFNLNQKPYVNPIGPDELLDAELHLSREQISDLDSNNCDQRTLLKNPNDNNDQFSKNRLRPRFQRVYVLQITGYDAHNEPITRIVDSRKIDTQDSSDLMFDVRRIVKFWLENPAQNYGVIVRVMNDEDEIRQMKSSGKSTEKPLTNASSNNNDSESQIMTVEEHVRLRREFRCASESEESWARKRPRIYIFSIDPPEAASERRHVKRDHSADEFESMQADDPGAATSDPANNDHSTHSPGQISETSQANENQTQPSKQNATYSATSASSTSIPTSQHRSTPGHHPVSRRDSRHNASTNQNSRNLGTTRSSHGPMNQRARGKAKSAAIKCGIRQMEINLDDVGWSNWIIAPQRYFANYCAGDCSFPMSDLYNATNHAIIQSIFHSVGRAVPRSCCAPTKLSKMAILYQLDGSVQMRYYDDMIAESCGCL